jgi:predicted NUDIX family NTP pyrophosphohydrolase
MRGTGGGVPRSSRRPVLVNKDQHAWSVSKGEVEPGEDLLHAAHREFSEETGLTLAGRTIPLAPIRQASGKLVHVWAIEADIDPSVVQSNSFPLEWPPRSGQVRQFPEVDRAAWFDLADARSKIHKGQVALLDEVNSKLGG